MSPLPRAPSPASRALRASPRGTVAVALASALALAACGDVSPPASPDSGPPLDARRRSDDRGPSPWPDEPCPASRPGPDEQAARVIAVRDVVRAALVQTTPPERGRP